MVIDKKSGGDITRTVLLQVISDQEQNAAAILSEHFLAQVIRCHGRADPLLLANRLDETLRRYLTELNGVSSADTINPLTAGPQMP